MSKPYIYVMPQAFIEDIDVPARWRVWGYVNGFFVNNQTCWASNETIGEKIKAHKDTVSKAVGELEEIGLISCERTRRTRLISPIIRREIGTNAYQERGSTPISDRHERLSISDSISDSIKTDSLRSSDSSSLGKLFQPTAEKEEERAPKKEKDIQSFKAATYWLKLCEKNTNSLPTSSIFKIQGIIKNARKSLVYSQIKEMMDAWFDEQSLEQFEMIQITRCLSPIQIDKYLAENV